MLLNLYHPLRAFEEICMLDQLSGADLISALAAAPSRWNFRFFGVSPADAQHRYNEAAEIVLKAMETDTLTYTGRHFSISDVPITLSPFQKPYPPLWYGGDEAETSPMGCGEFDQHRLCRREQRDPGNYGCVPGHLGGSAAALDAAAGHGSHCRDRRVRR